MIIDTDVLIWYFRGNEAARTFLASLSRRERIASIVTWMELVQGARSRDEIRMIRRFLKANFEAVLPLTPVVSMRAMALLEEYAPSHGLRLGDALIAATALEHALSLSTGNARHYSAIPGVEVLRFVPTG